MGGLGSSYFQNKFFLDKLTNISWNIIEQEKFVEKGKKLFPNGEIKFFENLLEANTICEHDFILLSGVIQYLKEPFLILNQILKYNFKYILLDRTPVSKLDEEFITIQTTTPDYPYFASYPCWIFSEKKLLNHIKKNFNLIFEWEASPIIKIEKISVIFKGFLLYKKSLKNYNPSKNSSS